MNTRPKLYGIKTCDTVRKAKRWLDSHEVDYEFVDFKGTPPEIAQTTHWLNSVGSDTLINRRSTTWRQLDDSQKALTQTAELAALLVQQPTLIKRPLLELDGEFTVGFAAEKYQTLLQQQ